MKFATLALLGAVSAEALPEFEDELIEDAKTHYPAKTVGEWFKGMGEIGGVMKEARRDFMKKHPHAPQRMMKLLHQIESRYGPVERAWKEGAAYQKAEKNGMKLLTTSKKFAVVAKDVMELIHALGENEYEMDWGFNKDGSYDESISNKGARDLFEDLYELSTDFVKFFNSKAAKHQRELEAATMNDPNFHKMVGMFMHDMGAKDMQQLEARLGRMARRVARDMSNCKYFKKTVRILMRLHHLVESTKVVSELGTEKEWTQWWNKKNFQNPFEKMDWEEEMLI